MKNIIVKNLNFSYGNKVILKDLNFEIEKNTITTIIGPNGSGKSTLVKILVGLLKSSGTIKIEDMLLVKENIREIRKNIGVVFENPDNQFVAETVMDDIAFTLENMNYNKKEIKEKVEKIAEYLNITDILEVNPHLLSGGKKQMVALGSALVHNPKILILDEALTYVDNFEKENIYKVLTDLKKKGLTIINVTHDIEETLFSDNIIVLNNGIVFNGRKEDLYKSDIKKLGFDLPFIVELSNRLIFYDLIDRIYYDMEELVNTLWK